MSQIMNIQVNGTTHRIETAPERNLLSVLRDDLDLTGSKYGCGEGQCGACTVLLDGQPVRSCLIPMRTAVGKAITTIEGLETKGPLHPLQQALLDEDAMQCGYCIPGMIMACVPLLKKNPQPGEPEIKRSLEGNLCRCGVYSRIVMAVLKAAQALKRGRS